MEPILRGHIKFPDDGRTIWEGKWGMTLAAFEEENVDQLNTFRYTCPTRVDFVVGDAVSFKGYFEVSSVNKGAKSQFTDKVLDIAVIEESEESGLRIVKGKGINRFGNFDISGAYNPATAVLEVRRIYGPKPIGSQKSASKKQHQQIQSLNAVTTSPDTLETSELTDSVSSNDNLPESKGKNFEQPQSPSSPTEVQGTPTKSSSSKQHSQVIENTTQIPIDLSFYPEAKAVLRDLKGKDVNKWFSAPVDAEALGLRDYYSVVKSPMDLGTIQSKLDAKRYHSWEECLADMRLTFVNALMYNPRSSLVYKAASDINSFLDERIGRVRTGKLSQEQLTSSIGKRAQKKKKFFEPGDILDTAASMLAVSKKTPKSAKTPAVTHASSSATMQTTKKSKKLKISVKKVKINSDLVVNDLVSSNPAVFQPIDVDAIPFDGPSKNIEEDEEGVDSFDELDEKDVFMTPPHSDDEGNDDDLVNDTPLSGLHLISDFNAYGAMSPTNLGDANDF